jgi:hypothetical protein
VRGRDRSPDLRRAYRAAWADRQATGDDSDEVLLRRLRLEGLTGLSAPTQEHLLDFWRRRVPPSRLTWEVAKLGFGAFRQVSSAFVSIALSFRGGVTYRVLTLQPSDTAFDDLPDWSQAAPDEWFTWVDFDVTSLPPGEARVVREGRVVGTTTLPGTVWQQLRDAEPDEPPFVGTLEVRERDGEVVDVALAYGENRADDLDD